MNKLQSIIYFCLLGTCCHAVPPSYKEALLSIASKGLDDYLGTHLEYFSVPRSTLSDHFGGFSQPIDKVRSNSWERLATFQLRLKWGDIHKKLYPCFQALGEAEWTPETALAGLARTRIRVLSDKQSPYLELFIWLERSSILYEGRWYIVDREVLNGLIDAVITETRSRLNDVQ